MTNAVGGASARPDVERAAPESNASGAFISIRVVALAAIAVLIVGLALNFVTDDGPEGNSTEALHASIAVLP
ncbi:MAG: hypothetical protein AAF385_16925, partial [Pseudomonadota bacterium]